MAVTYTLAISDKYSNTLFSRASLASATANVILADKFGGTAEYSPLRIPVSGPLTVTITASEVSQGAYDGHLYIEQNGVPGVSTFSVDFAGGTDSGTTTVAVNKGYLVGIAVTAGALTSPSLSPSISPSISPSTSPSASVSPSISPSLSPSISSSVSPSASLSPSISPSVSPSISPSISPSLSPSISSSESPSPSTG